MGKHAEIWALSDSLETLNKFLSLSTLVPQW